MTTIYEGFDVDVLAQEQTLKPKPKREESIWFTGYQKLGMDWYDYGIFPEIPLELRYDSFKRRLAVATAKIGKVT